MGSTVGLAGRVGPERVAGHAGQSGRKGVAGLCRLMAGLAQAAVLIGIWALCEAGARAVGLPLPGGVLGMLVLLALLLGGVVPLRWLRRGAGGLLDHMLLFFVPASLTLLDHRELVSLTGLKLLAVIVVGIVTVMAGTAIVVELHLRGRLRHVR